MDVEEEGGNLALGPSLRGFQVAEIEIFSDFITHTRDFDTQSTFIHLLLLGLYAEELLAQNGQQQQLRTSTHILPENTLVITLDLT